MGQKHSSPVKIEGHCDAKFLRVKDHFKEMISKGSDENLQLCVYVNGQCVIDLFGSITDDYNDNAKQIIFSSGKNIEAIVMAVLHDKGTYLLVTKFLDARIQDESTSISIELRKMTKIIKFEEMSEPDDESDKHI